MKASETVMKELVYDSGLVINFSITEREIAETQAEVSFKAGMKESKDAFMKHLRGLAKEGVSLYQAIDILEDNPS